MTDSRPVVTFETDSPLPETCEALDRAVKGRSFGVIAVHDLQEIMRKKGVELDRGCRVFEVCNPAQAKRVLDEQMAISSVLPCRISVYEQGGKTCLSTVDPTALLGAFDATGLEEVAREVADVMISSMREAAGLA